MRDRTALGGPAQGTSASTNHPWVARLAQETLAARERLDRPAAAQWTCLILRAAATALAVGDGLLMTEAPAPHADPAESLRILADAASALPVPLPVLAGVASAPSNSSRHAGLSDVVQALLAVSDFPPVPGALLQLHSMLAGSPATRAPDGLVRRAAAGAMASNDGRAMPRVLDVSMSSAGLLIDALDELETWVDDVALRSSTHCAPPGLDSRRLRRWVIADAVLYGVAADLLLVDITRFELWRAIGVPDSAPAGLTAHILAGNPLLGCRVDDLAAMKGGKRAFERGITARRRLLQGDTTAPEVLEARLSCNLRTSLWIPAPPMERTADGTVQTEPLLRRAADLARRRRFLHWDLAFPEVFCDRSGEPRADSGFDLVMAASGKREEVVIARSVAGTDCPASAWVGDGHPPGEAAPAMLVRRGHELARPGGTVAAVIPEALLSDRQHEPFRRFLIDEAALAEIRSEQAGSARVVSRFSITTRKPRGATPEAGAVRIVHSGDDAKDVAHADLERNGRISAFADEVTAQMERCPMRLRDLAANEPGLAIEPDDLLRVCSGRTEHGWLLRPENVLRFVPLHLPGHDRYRRAAAPEQPSDGVLVRYEAGRLMGLAVGPGETGMAPIRCITPTPANGISHVALALILNSSAASYYVWKALANRSTRDLPPDDWYLGPLPLPDVNAPCPDTSLASEIARRLETHTLANAPIGDVLHSLGARMSSLGRRIGTVLDEASRTLVATYGWGDAAKATDLIARDVWFGVPEEFRTALLARDRKAGSWPASTWDGIMRLYRDTERDLATLAQELGHPPCENFGSLSALADDFVYTLYGLSEADRARISDAHLP